MEVDPQFRTRQNLNALQKIDKSVVKIITNVPLASMYLFDRSANCWNKLNIEGPFFIVERSEVEKFSLIIANRLTLENFTFIIDESFYAEVDSPIITFKSNNDQEQLVFGIWVADAFERANIFQHLSRCVQICQKTRKVETKHQTLTQVESRSTQVPTTKDDDNKYAKVDANKLLVPGTILGMSNVASLGSSDHMRAHHQKSLLLKTAISDVLLSEEMIQLLHSKYIALRNNV